MVHLNDPLVMGSVLINRVTSFLCMVLITTSFSFLFVKVADAQTKKVRVSIPTLGMPSIALTVASVKGYYQQEGLDVELILMSAGVATRALIGGNVEFTSAAGAAFPAVLSGAPLRFLFVSYNRPIFWLYAKSEIRDIGGLIGKKVGVSNIGSAPDYFLREVLKKHGLEGGRDVAILALGLQATIYGGLVSGAVDAAMITPPFTFMAAEAGYRELVSFAQQDLVHLQGSIIAGEKLLKSDSKLVEKFVRGTLKGYLYARDNRSGTVPILAQNVKIKEDQAGRYYDVYRLAMTSDGTVSEELQRRSLDNVLKLVGVKEPPPLEKIFDFSLARKARAQLEAEGWRPKP